MTNTDYTASNAAQRAADAAHFIEANRMGEARHVISPSGRYRLAITEYGTDRASETYTLGVVTRISDGATICELQRCDWTFHHSFVMKDDREYLISGRSYMSQTIVDLDRGIEYEPPGDHYDGSAFIWFCCWLSSDGNTLAVEGCNWGCPYEYRLFDFTDPAAGWPELPLVGASHLGYTSDGHPPRWLDAVTLECVCEAHDAVPQQRIRVQRRGNEVVVL